MPHPNIRENPAAILIIFINIHQMIHKFYFINKKGLKHHFLKAIDPIYPIIIWYHVTGFNNISTHQRFIHIYLTYGNIKDIDI